MSRLKEVKGIICEKCSNKGMCADDVKCNPIDDLYKIFEEANHLKKTKIPRCHYCKKNWITAVDSITKKKSKYSWKPNCKCINNPIRMSIG